MRVRSLLFGVLALAPACTCNKPQESTGASVAEAAAPPAVAQLEADAGGSSSGLSAPIAAAHVGGGVVIVAGLDVPARAIRIQRIDAKDAITAERTVLSGISWSSEADLKLAPAGAGVALTWRGKRDGQLVRQLVVLGADLAPLGEPTEVTAAACATKDALWSTDGKHAMARPWTGSSSRFDLPKDKDVSLVCGAHRAFALLDEDDGTSLALLGADASGPASLLAESAFGEDEQRERAEYTVGDDLGVVRLATSGALAIREVKGGAVGALQRLKTKLSRDADVVAVDASAKVLVVVHTEEGTEPCDGGTSTKVIALRVDRTTLDEATIELSPGACGREVGPFFTGALAEGVAISWVERVPTAGKARAPIAGLVHRAVPGAGAPPPLARVDQPADALVDAGCDGARCFAVALARRPGMDAMVPGVARVIRYP